MLNDPIANALSLIMNAEKIGRQECTIKPVSKVLKQIFTIMKDNQYIGSYEEIEDGKGGFIKVNLLGKINRCAAIKPRLSVKKDNFEKYEKRHLPAKGMGLLIVTTQKGVMVAEEAKKKDIGGRLLAYCY